MSKYFFTIKDFDWICVDGAWIIKFKRNQDYGLPFLIGNEDTGRFVWCNGTKLPTKHTVYDKNGEVFGMISIGLIGEI